LASTLGGSIPTLRRASHEGLYLDRASEFFSSRALHWFSSRVLFRGAEVRVVGGAVLGIGQVLRVAANSGLRHLHPGLAHASMFLMIAGTAAVVGYLLL
jgi:hypothetical protein